MARISRRDFLRQAGQAGLALGIGAQLGALGGCGDNDVEQPSGAYDAIIVGGGTAGTIVAAKLQHASGGRKRILIIEAGGPTTAALGGMARPPWLPPDRNDLTMFDVPGAYSQMAHMPFGMPYQLTETLFTFQGIGLGGNSVFNGMLFQTNPPAVFDRRRIAITAKYQTSSVSLTRLGTSPTHAHAARRTVYRADNCLVNRGCGAVRAGHV